MDYEKEYKEAVGKIKDLLKEKKKKETTNCLFEGELNDIFPGLAESEDEKIRKGLIAIITDFDGLYLQENYSLSREDALTWLEKQGEQKPAEKTTWYDNMDDLIADAMIDDIKNADMPEHCKHNRITWINKHRGKPAEWSEEDEKGFGDALWCCKQAASIAKDENDAGNIWYAENWLKSLKDRYAFKPSKEQLNGLKEAIEFLGCTKTRREQLQSLYEQLKKLREG